MNPPTTTRDAYIQVALMAIVTPDEEASIEAMIWSEIYRSQMSIRELKAADREIDRQMAVICGPRPN